MFGIDRLFTSDHEIVTDTDGKEWLVLHEVTRNKNGLFAMVVPANAVTPCPVEFVMFAYPQGPEVEVVFKPVEK